jgi:hypothetical protein
VPSATATATVPESHLALLLPALRRLDTLLGQAIGAAEAMYGAGTTSDPFRGLYVSTDEAKKLVAREPGAPPLLVTAAETGPPVTARMAWLQQQFALTDFDMDTILVALAPEIDLRYERLYAYLQDDVTRKRPSLDLALTLLCPTPETRVSERTRFAPDAPLIRNSLLHLSADTPQQHTPLLASTLKLDDAVVRFLLGQECLDARLASFCSWETRAQEEPSVDGTRKALRQLAVEAREHAAGLRLYLQGASSLGRVRAARAVAAAMQAGLLVADLGRMPAPNSDALIRLVFREALLLRSALYLDGLDGLRTDDRAALLHDLLARLEEAPGVVLLGGDRDWAPLRASSGVIAVRFDVPAFPVRRQYWEAHLAAAGVAITGDDLDRLAGAFRFTAEQIEDAVAGARSQARLSGAETPGGEAITISSLFATARAQSSGNLGTLARKVVPLYTWDDIVLPDDQVAQLREICGQAKYRHIVLGDWGFDRRLSMGKGLNVLFAGPPGTGKTMAAEIIANELRLDLYKIDLSQVVSKYIGETEKNLSRIFNEARATNAIIFFDEADALFGKRSEVRDAHDRYANIEIAYLLQKMEEYEGISILATNLRQNLDQAFTRRLSFTVDFPFPDEASRLLIWRQIWPRETPLDSSLDLQFVAAQFKLSGGSVKNVALASAFMAAEENDRVRTVHLLKAVRREFQKMGRTVPKSEFGHYWNLLELAG